jgi:hypothetical protein
MQQTEREAEELSQANLLRSEQFIMLSILIEYVKYAYPKMVAG